MERSPGDTLLRHWAMLQRVPRAPAKCAAGEIKTGLASEGYSVSKRTIERDLRTLSGIFPLRCDERDRPYGWSWSADAAVLTIPAMTPQAALVLRMARDYLAQVLPQATVDALAPYYERSDQVLAEAPGSIGSWPERVRIISRGQPLLAPEIDPNVLTEVYRAVQAGERVHIDYYRRRVPRQCQYKANPLGVVLRDGVITLVATLFDYDNPVQLHLHRMQTAKRLDEPRQWPAGFDLDDWIKCDPMGYSLGEDVAIELQVTDEIAKHLEETPLSRDQTLEERDDGWRRLMATVADTEQLRWWLLGLAANVRVVAPELLRDEVTKRLRETLTLYE